MLNYSLFLCTSLTNHEVIRELKIHIKYFVQCFCKYKCKILILHLHIKFVVVIHCVKTSRYKLKVICILYSTYLSIIRFKMEFTIDINS
jgi:hypothetical protein